MEKNNGYVEEISGIFGSRKRNVNRNKLADFVVLLARNMQRSRAEPVENGVGEWAGCVMCASKLC